MERLERRNILGGQKTENVACLHCKNTLKFDGCWIVIKFIVFVIFINWFSGSIQNNSLQIIKQNQRLQQWYHTYQNLLENLNQFIYKFKKTLFSGNVKTYLYLMCKWRHYDVILNNICYVNNNIFIISFLYKKFSL